MDIICVINKFLKIEEDIILNQSTDRYQIEKNYKKDGLNC